MMYDNHFMIRYHNTLGQKISPLFFFQSTLRDCGAASFSVTFTQSLERQIFSVSYVTEKLPVETVAMALLSNSSRRENRIFSIQEYNICTRLIISSEISICSKYFKYS